MKTIRMKKGFTLIEIVIVIVIIAILAAILVPRLLAWIDKADDTKALSAAKTVEDCLTAEIASLYKTGDVLGSDQDDFDDDFYAAVTEAANTTVTNDSTADGYVTFTIVDKKITGFTYTTGNKVVSKTDKGTLIVGKAD